MQMIYTPVCPECHKSFKTDNSQKKYCDDLCQSRAKHKRASQKYYSMMATMRPKKKGPPKGQPRHLPPQDGQKTLRVQSLLCRPFHG